MSIAKNKILGKVQPNSEYLEKLDRIEKEDSISFNNIEELKGLIEKWNR